MGNVLAATPGVRFVYEPLNAQIGVVGVPQQFVYTTAGGRHEPDLTRVVTGLLDGRARFHSSTIDAPASLSRLATRRILGSRVNVRYRVDAARGGRRWLLKDPFAAFSSEWLQRRFGTRTIVTVRHPAAVVHSYLRLGWTFGLEDLAAQPELIADHDLAEIVGRGGGYGRVESAARLWAATYTVLGRYLDRNEGFVAARHEDLSAQPEQRFAELFAHADESFDERARRHVRALTGDHNPSAPDSGSVHTLRRDSRADLGRWKRELSAADVDTVRRFAGPVAARWYSDDEWVLAV